MTLNRFTAGLLLAMLCLLVVPVYPLSSGDMARQDPSGTSNEAEYVTLKVEVFGEGYVIPWPGVRTIRKGTTINLQVLGVAVGYEFDHWEVNDEFYGYAPFKTLTLEDDMVVRAVFVETAMPEETGYLVVDLSFYDEPSIPPVGFVILWELGLNETLTPVQVAPGEQHSQVVFKGVRVGKTYTVVVHLENGFRDTYVAYWTVYDKASYMHWGLMSNLTYIAPPYVAWWNFTRF